MPRLAIIIPARWASTRFPGKPLALLAGQPVIRHVYAAAVSACPEALVSVATDDTRILDAVRHFGGNAVMTRSDHASGTDRILEALATLDTHGDISCVVNVQGDEPLIRPERIRLAVDALSARADVHWSTLVYPLAAHAAVLNPNVVKVVLAHDNTALYFSRAAIPFDRDATGAARYFGHIGLYVYRIDALRQFAAWPPGKLEQSEKLEQLRALEHGLKIQCVCVEDATIGIDTPEDLRHAEELLKAHPELSNIV